MFASKKHRSALPALTISAVALSPLCLPANAQYAQLEAEDWYVSPMASYIFEDKDRLADGGYGGQIGLGRMISEHFALEFNMNGGRMPGFNDTGFYGAGLDALAIGNLDGVVAPFALAGIGWENANVSENPNASVFAEDRDGYRLSFGGGAMFKLGTFPGSLRSEIRLRTDLGEGTNLTDVYFNTGLVIPLGEKAPRVGLDSDNDGVPNSADRCPNTAPGSIVDAEGCELDSDGDGVADRRDQCPGTARGIEVDPRGCEIDSDGDGVVDSRDDCPGTPRGTPVGSNGCPLDDDLDGVLNRSDDCPNTRRGARVDYRGCEIRDEIQLPGVNFETNADLLLGSSRRTLDGAVSTLRRYQDIEVECAGHTDSRGAADYNQSLSQRRAQAVCDFLEAAGIDGDRLSVRGYGESDPIADNDTAQGRAANRRVTLRVRGE